MHPGCRVVRGLHDALSTSHRASDLGTDPTIRCYWLPWEAEAAADPAVRVELATHQAANVWADDQLFRTTPTTAGRKLPQPRVTALPPGSAEPCPDTALLPAVLPWVAAAFLDGPGAGAAADILRRPGPSAGYAAVVTADAYAALVAQVHAQRVDATLFVDPCAVATAPGAALADTGVPERVLRCSRLVDLLRSYRGHGGEATFLADLARRTDAAVVAAQGRRSPSRRRHRPRS